MNHNICLICEKNTHMYQNNWIICLVCYEQIVGDWLYEEVLTPEELEKVINEPCHVINYYSDGDYRKAIFERVKSGLEVWPDSAHPAIEVSFGYILNDLQSRLKEMNCERS